MNRPLGTDDASAAGDGGALDPRDAAMLLEQSRREAQRAFDLNPPLLSVLGSALFLVGFGAIWLSVRGQHPYQGPTAAALAVLYGGVAVAAVVGRQVIRRATAGVSGRALRQRRAQIAIIVTAYVAVSVYQGALYHDGVSRAIVYGVFPATAQLMVVAPIAAAMAAAREEWVNVGAALAVTAVAAGSAFTGPVGAWGFTGVGCCAVGLGRAVALAWQRRSR